MEKFFEDNIYVLFALIIYYLLVKEKPNKDNKKIIVIYIFISMLALFNILDLKKMLLLLLVCLFLYFEILVEDDSKFLILRKIFYKLVDFFYLLICKYNFLLFVFSLIFISETFQSKVKLPFVVNFVLFFLILLMVIKNVISNEFELESFSKIHDKLKKYDFGNYKMLNSKQTEILLFLEDRSFFERKNDYTFLCWDFLKYRLYRINEVVNRIQRGKNQRHPLGKVFIFMKYVCKQIYLQINDIKKIRKYIRGYSTIEMQLFRSIAVKNGYTKVIDRKIAELIYSQLFFKGLKDFYKLNYKTVSSEYFKKYLLVNYIEYAPIFINGKQTFIKSFWGKDIELINDSEFFLSVLCLPEKININKLSYSYIINNFENLVVYFNLNLKELKQAIVSMKNLAAKM